MLGAADSVTDFSMLSNPAGAHNASCLGFYDMDFFLKNVTYMSWLLPILSYQYLCIIIKEIILYMEASEPKQVNPNDF